MNLGEYVWEQRSWPDSTAQEFVAFAILLLASAWRTGDDICVWAGCAAEYLICRAAD